MSNKSNKSASYDFIVVGGGTSGCVVAKRLSEQKKPNSEDCYTVCLIEFGPTDENNASIHDLPNWPNLLGTDYDYDYTIEAQLRGNSTIRHSRAKVLGGCSSHNSCIAFRTPDSDLDTWERLTGKTGEWSPEKVDKCFEKLYKQVTFETANQENELCRAVIQSAQEAGLPRVTFDKRRKNLQIGAGHFVLNKKGTTRQSSSIAYLHPISSLPKNLTIMTDTQTFRVLLDSNNVAIGVETDKGVILANNEVIVSCGAFDSPKLLLLSGIGPRWHLREVGVPLRKHLPGVGENLLDHPEGVVIWETTQQVPQHTSNYWDVGIFAKTGVENSQDTEKDIPDLMFHLGIVPFDMHTVKEGYKALDVKFGISLTPNVMRAKSKGHVRLRSSNPADSPKIDMKYFTDPEGYDEEVMINGIKIARKILSNNKNKWVLREVCPGPEVKTDKQLSEYVRKTANTVYHPAGTCAMGNGQMSVVDTRLRVHGIKNLRVADASIFPSMVSINPCITAMVIGERCAEMVAEDNANKSFNNVLKSCL